MFLFKLIEKIDKREKYGYKKCKNLCKGGRA